MRGSGGYSGVACLIPTALLLGEAEVWGITEIVCLEFLQGLMHQIGGRMSTFASDKVAVKL